MKCLYCMEDTPMPCPTLTTAHGCTAYSKFKQSVRLGPIPTNAREEFLTEVRQCILQDRDAAYGPPEANFADIATIASTRFQGGPNPLFSRPMRADEVADFLIAVKFARRKTSPEKLDHLIDIGGYAGCGYACVKAQTSAKD